MGYTRLADQPFHAPPTMLRVIPQMMRLQSYRTVYGLVAHYISDERLRQALTFEPLLVGGNPFTTTSIYLLIHWLERKWGVHFAEGGTTALVHALVRLLGRVGRGRAARHARSSEILVARRPRGRRPHGLPASRSPPTSSSSQRGPVVRLRPHAAALGAAAAHRRAGAASAPVDEPVRRATSAAAGSTRSWRTTPIVLGPRYRPLLDDIFRRRVLADDFSLYLHAPTRDGPVAGAGGDGDLLRPLPRAEQPQRGGLGDGAGAVLGPRAGRAERRVLPGIAREPGERDVLTPRVFEHDLRSVDGAAFGPEPILTQSAYFRYHNQSGDVPGLYFVGAGTHPGGGVPGVLSSAKVLERVAPRPERPVPVPSSTPPPRTRHSVVAV